MIQDSFEEEGLRGAMENVRLTGPWDDVSEPPHYEVE
jgi:hypothetical protein